MTGHPNLTPHTSLLASRASHERSSTHTRHTARVPARPRVGEGGFYHSSRASTSTRANVAGAVGPRGPRRPACRSFALLRSSTEDRSAQDAMRERILDAYNRLEAAL